MRRRALSVVYILVFAPFGGFIGAGCSMQNLTPLSNNAIPDIYGGMIVGVLAGAVFAVMLADWESRASH